MAQSMFKLKPNQEVVLTLGKRYLSYIEDRGLAKESLQISSQDRIDYLGQMITASWNELEDKIAEDHYPVNFYYKVPSSWFQMLKLSLPKALRERFPVKYHNKSAKRTVHFTRFARYPKANVTVPKDTPFFMAHLGGVELIEDRISVEDKS